MLFDGRDGYKHRLLLAREASPFGPRYHARCVALRRGKLALVTGIVRRRRWSIPRWAPPTVFFAFGIAGGLTIGARPEAV